ncbi:5-methyltetrahydropteroyltriglutamate--homocysteine S-methyltransferase [Candidatus Vidania fulgoroideorum]
MIKTHILGAPIIGKNRELKFYLEKFIRNEINLKELNKINKSIIKKNIKIQNKYNDIITLGFHFFFDRMIYTMVILGILPKRFKFFKKIGIKELIILYKGYKNINSLKMLKWFDTNYHYFVPEIDSNISKKFNCDLLFEEISNYKFKKELKISFIGPITFLELSDIKIKKKKALLNIINRYKKIILKLKKKFKIKYIQIEEPILSQEFLLKKFFFYKKKILKFYNFLHNKKIKIFFIYYFNNLNKNIINFVNKNNFYSFHFNSKNNLSIIKNIKKNIKISLGIVKGDNIWILNKKKVIKKIQKIQKIRKLYFISGNCSFLHIPYDKKYEFNSKIYNFISFYIQKIKELYTIKNFLRYHETKKIEENIKYLKKFKKIKKPMLSKNDKKIIEKISNFKRKKITKKDINLKKKLPFTTIGSFPQTNKLRNIREKYIKGKIYFSEYKKKIKNYINYNYKIQKKISIDYFVNGEPERSDMVDFFFKNFSGCYITKNGWVQSYGTRCVKPPIIYGLIKRKKSNITDWYKKKKKLKGIVTGPITMIKWSFIRNGINMKSLAFQISKAISYDIKDLKKIGCKIIQIDEPALKEFITKYNKKNIGILIKSFNFSCRYIYKKKIQIHSHICYSNLDKNDFKYINKMFIDVLSIESSKNIKNTVSFIKKNKILKNLELGIGVYDVHSSSIPNIKKVYKKIKYIVKELGYNKIWINPDCGLKTRNYKEVMSSLINIKKAILKTKINLPK